MQKLEERNTYTPTDAPQVRCNCDPALNREETLSLKNPSKKDEYHWVFQSVPGSKTSSNNSEVDISQHRKQDLRVPVVYVLNMRGQPLMPTTPGKAIKLLKRRKAKIVKRLPLTIQFVNYATGENKQTIELGIDSGYTTIGFSAISGKKELAAGEVAVRTDIPEKLTERRAYRRGRRNRHQWYREARFDNRGREDGWLTPSMNHRQKTHINLIEKLKKILPVTSITIEVASFDTQKMQNPEITGVEYQQGELRGYEVREYLLEKFQRECAYCGKTDIPLEVEHIVPKSRGGSDRVSNLTISCHKCNQKKGNKTAEEFGHPEVQEQAKQSLKATAFMNTVRWMLVNQLNCNYTYGYITKHNRIKLGLEKSHANDAFVIAGGTSQTRAIPYTVKQNRRNNRALQLNRNGFKPSIRRKRYEFQPNDLVRYEGYCFYLKGVCNYGNYVSLKNSEGKMIYPNIKNVELVTYGKGLQFISTALLSHLKVGVPAPERR